jgi:hypothetical protein
MGSDLGSPTWWQSPADRFIAISRAPSGLFTKWLAHTLKVGVYELRGGEIISCRGWRPEVRFEARTIVAWRVYAEMGFDIIAIELADGSMLNWIDKYNDLIGILRKIASDRELPWTFA